MFLLQRKVDLYWPENLNEPINYGNIVVEMTNFSQLNKYTIRNFKISWVGYTLVWSTLMGSAPIGVLHSCLFDFSMEPHSMVEG